MLRDRDTNGDPTSLEERRYYCQNLSRGDVSAVITDTGKMVEWVKYSAYGTPFALPAGDTDSDGDWDATDSGAVAGGYDIRKDADLDGDVDAADVTHADSIASGYQTLGRNVLSSSAVGNRKGYAGYERDAVVLGTGPQGRAIWHVRYRVLDSGLGRWLQRDPAGYVDGASLYAYAGGKPITSTDAMGLCYRECVGCANSLLGQGLATEAILSACLVPEPLFSKLACGLAILALGSAIYSTINDCDSCIDCSAAQRQVPMRPPTNGEKCVGETSDRGLCGRCCVRKHGADVRKCGDQYIAAQAQCGHDRGCMRKATKSYETCLKWAAGDYNQCYRTCLERFPTINQPPLNYIPPVPSRPIEPLPTIWFSSLMRAAEATYDNNMHPAATGPTVGE